MKGQEAQAKLVRSRTLMDNGDWMKQFVGSSRPAQATYLSASGISG